MCELLDKIENKGIEKGIFTSVKSLMDSMGISVENAMELLKVPSDMMANLKEKLAA